MPFDLELILVVGTAITGLLVLYNRLILKASRDAEPWYIDYSRSFFPVLLIVLVLRSFIAEPFRIPSGSMMPTLLHGDFILVNKFSYGIRLPVIHKKIWSFGDPQRGDVAVFRFPDNPDLDYIKRVVGLPGDQIGYRDKVLYVNGKPAKQVISGTFFGEGRDRAMNGAQIRREQLGEVAHDILIVPRLSNFGGQWLVPEGHYFVMGDNRDNSNDSRGWGFVPEENLVGKAFIVWMNMDFAAWSFDSGRAGLSIQ